MKQENVCHYIYYIHPFKNETKQFQELRTIYKRK